MNFWNNQGCGCNKYEEEKNYYFKCEMVEKECPCKKEQQYNQNYMPNKNCCCR